MKWHSIDDQRRAAPRPGATASARAASAAVIRGASAARRRALLAALLACLAPRVAAQPQRARFSDAEAWSRVFDDPARDAWQKPDEVIAALRLPPDAVVADIGAGTGYFTVRLAKALPRGRVIAADIEPDMVRHIEQRARQLGLGNVTAVLAAPDDPRLPEGLDGVLVVNTYHHIGEREAYFRRLATRLSPAGTVAIIDHRRDSPTGPPVAMRLPPETIVAEMKRAGYVLAAEHGFLPRQHFLVFRRAPAGS